MRTKTMAVAVVAIFVLPLIGIAQVASTEIKTYTSEEHDYSIDLPADCLFVDSGAPYAKHYDEPDIRCHSLKNRVAISVYFSKLDSENEEGEGGTSLLQRFVDAEIDRYGKEYHSVYKTYKTSTDAGEEVIVAQLKIGRLSKENRYFLKKDHETACIIICRAGAGIYEKTNQEILEPMIRSFKFTGEPTSTPTPIPKITWETYTNKEYGYSIDYPSNMEIRGKIKAFPSKKLGFDCIDFNGPSVSIRVWSSIKFPEDWPPDEVIDHIGDAFHYPKHPERRIETINGEKAIVLEKQKEEIYHTKFYIFKHDGKIYMIDCMELREPDNYEYINTEYFEPMAKSFRFISSSEPTPTPEPEQCLEYYIKFEGKKRYGDMHKDGEKLYMYFENGTAVPWIFERGFFHNFDCSEMSAMYERKFENEGYHAKIRCSKFNLFKLFKGEGHCWVVLENKDGSWTVFEATTQKIVKDNCKIKARYSSWGGEYETIKDALGPLYIRYIPFNWWDHFDEYKDINW